MSKCMERCKTAEWFGSRKLLVNLKREEHVADTDVGESRWNLCYHMPSYRSGT